MRLKATEPLTFPSLGWLVGAWIEQHCVVPDRYLTEESAAAGVRDAFRLYGEQLRYLVHHYRIRPTAQVGQLNTAFVYRMSMLVRPQKWGKGPLRSAMICAEGVGPVLFAGFAPAGAVYKCSDHGCRCGWVYAYEPGEPMGRRWGSGTSPTPMIQITANSDDQTDNVYKSLRPMIELGPLALLIPKTGEELIRLPGGGDIHTVTSNAKSRLGARVTFVPQDEAGLYTKRNGMVAVADTQHRGVAGMGGRAALDTNGWDPAENSTAQMLDEGNLPDVLVDFKEPPQSWSYSDRRERRRIHRFVYGDSLTEHGGHVDLESIEADAAALVLRDAAQAARFYGNKIVQGKGTWLVEGRWNGAVQGGLLPDGSMPRREPPPDGTQICLGFDGSESDDWTAIRAETIDGYQFTPLYGPDRQPTWWDPADSDGRIPRLQVDVAVEELHRRYRVKRFYCDPRDWQSAIGGWALAYGTAVEWPTNQVGRTWAALERVVTDLGTGALTHDGDPTVATHVANARKSAAAGQKYLLSKPAGAYHQKIDLAMASVLAHEAVMDALADGWGQQDALPHIAFGL